MPPLIISFLLQSEEDEKSNISEYEEDGTIKSSEDRNQKKVDGIFQFLEESEEGIHSSLKNANNQQMQQ